MENIEVILKSQGYTQEKSSQNIEKKTNKYRVHFNSNKKLLTINEFEIILSKEKIYTKNKKSLLFFKNVSTPSYIIQIDELN
jgi:hypothetical protein